MRRSSALLLLAAVFLVATAPAIAHAAGDALVAFKARCDYSHSSQDDPIVFPGQRSAAHRHDFFGATVTDAFTSSYEELLASPTTCNDREDHAAYWTPTVYAGGRQITPDQMIAYYRQGEKRPPFEAYPPGLRVVAGAPDREHFGWKCDGQGQGNAVGRTAPPASCPDGRVALTVEFPDCWDGVNRDSADHRSHMAYSEPGRNGVHACPASHPVQVPELNLFSRFRAPERPLTLSSGAADTLHADFFNGWEEDRLESLVDNCLNAGVRCNSVGRVVNPD